jgi:hypothetical protein
VKLEEKTKTLKQPVVMQGRAAGEMPEGAGAKRGLGLAAAQGTAGAAGRRLIPTME